MQNHRAYGTYGIGETDDEFQMTVAIKREKNPEDIDGVSRKGDNVVRLPWPENAVSENIGRAWRVSHGVVIDLRVKESDADPCVKKRRLRAHWEHIEGVGLRCTWIEEPEGESGAAPEAKTQATDNTSNAAGTEPDPGTDAD
jgi:hypothetical protein